VLLLLLIDFVKVGPSSLIRLLPYASSVLSPPPKSYDLVTLRGIVLPKKYKVLRPLPFSVRGFFCPQDVLLEYSVDTISEYACGLLEHVYVGNCLYKAAITKLAPNCYSDLNPVRVFIKALLSPYRFRLNLALVAECDRLVV
jgi:hypothetical protein